MILKTMWGMRRGETTPELMEAWDEYSVDSWPEGFEEACAKSRASWGNDLIAYRMIDLALPVKGIELAFASAVVTAEVVESKP